MLLGTLGSSLLGNLLTSKAKLEQIKAQLQPDNIFNAISSFNKWWNGKVLSKET